MTKNKKVLGATFLAVLALSFLVVRGQSITVNCDSVSAPNADQGFEVLPNIAPENLQAEITALNEKGYVLSRENLFIVRDKFVIIVSNADLSGVASGDVTKPSDKPLVTRKDEP